MMMLAAAVRAESGFSFFQALFCRGFRHCDHPSRWRIDAALSQRSQCRTSTGEDSNTRFITAEKPRNWNGKHCRSTNTRSAAQNHSQRHT
jgi:hypothetical protein